jgi:hypothetical protein
MLTIKSIEYFRIAMKNNNDNYRITADDIDNLIGNDIVSSELYEKISLLVMHLKLDMSPTEFIDTVCVARGLGVKE